MTGNRTKGTPFVLPAVLLGDLCEAFPVVIPRGGEEALVVLEVCVWRAGKPVPVGKSPLDTDVFDDFLQSVLGLEFRAAFPTAVMGFGIFRVWGPPVGDNVLAETSKAPDLEVDGVANFAGELDKGGVWLRVGV